MRHHRRFKHLDRRAVRVVRDVAKLHPWLMSPADQLDVANQLVDRLSLIYAMPAPFVGYGSRARETGGGYYLPQAHAITLSAFSLVTLLHEFRHAMQSFGARAISDDVEDDARGWSLSMYSRACPRRFRRMVREGRVLYVTEADL